MTTKYKNTKKNIAIFSLEMPAEQLIMRMISSLGQVDNKKLQNVIKFTIRDTKFKKVYEN